jgi:hypothetical protein
MTINSKARRIRHRNNKRWLNEIFAMERLSMMGSTPVMIRKEDKFMIYPQNVPQPPVIRHIADIRKVYKKEFGYRMTRKLSRTKQRQLFEKIGVKWQTIKFQRKDRVNVWRVPYIRRQNFMAIVAESLGKTVYG